MIVRLMVLVALAAHPAAAQSPSPEIERVYQIVVRRLVQQMADRPDLPRGPVVLYPYVLPAAVLAPEDGNPVGTRLPEALLEEIVAAGTVAGLCEPAPRFRCRGRTSGVVINLTTIRWDSPDRGRVVGQISALPRDGEMVVGPLPMARFGFVLTRREARWSVSQAVPIPAPRNR